MNDPKLGWMAWEADQSGGYASISYNFRNGFNQKKIEFSSAYTGGYDLLIAACTPTAWMFEPYVQLGQVRENMVMHTMFEAQPLPPGWVQNLNACGAIWTPSQYCVDLFRESGITRPIFKAGYGIDVDAYQPVYREDRKGPMRFGIWADTIPSRKNVFKAIQSFIEAGLPDAELEVKLHSFAGMSDKTTFSDSKGNPAANISLHTGSWPRKKLNTWLQSLDCMIYLSGGEGYGLMPVEAAATALTTICHRTTGMKEYLDDEAFYIVESDGLEKSISYSIGYGYECQIPKPNYDQAVEQIRYAYAHRAETYARGWKAYEKAMQLSWDKASDVAWDYLKLYHAYLQTRDERYLATFV